jgi:hypothetical protein
MSSAFNHNDITQQQYARAALVIEDLQHASRVRSRSAKVALPNRAKYLTQIRIGLSNALSTTYRLRKPGEH